MNILLKTILGLIFLITSISYSQKFKAINFSQLDTKDAKTDLVIQNKSPLSSIGVEHSKYDAYSFLQHYKEFSYSDNLNRFNQLDYLKRLVQPVSYANTVKIGIMHLDFEELKPNSLIDGLVKIETNYIRRISQEPILNVKEATIIAPFATHKRGLNSSFLIDDSFVINNTKNTIDKIEIDFNDNQGYRAVNINDYVNVSYLESGDKKIQFKLTLSNGTVIKRTSPLKVTKSRNDIANQRLLAPTEVNSSIIADLSSYSGATNHAGLAEYEIFLGADNELDKPIIIVDGFDPSDTRTIDGIYSLLNFESNGLTENLADNVRADENHDVVLINFPSYFVLQNGNLQSFAQSTDVNNDAVIDAQDYPGSTVVDGGADFIERNAFSVVDIITLINSQKIGDEENVIIGPSMGGLITRYALNYMEQDPGNVGFDHETRLWMSFDSPHLGANVPIGFQNLFNYLAYGLDTWVGNFSLESLRPIVDGMLKSPAARQMLTDHFEPHLANGEIAEFNPNLTLPIKHPYSTVFFSGINGLTTSGFPETTRNVSLINGSGIGNPYQHKNGDDVEPGDRVLDAFIPGVAVLTDAYFDVWYSPNAGQTIKIADIWIDAPWLCFCDINAETDAESESFSKGIDAAPGGLFDLGALAAGFGTADPTINAFFGSLTTDYFNFIPTVSAMALNTNPNIDWYENITLGTGDTPWDDTITTNPQTPFVNWYMPDHNEAHVTLTENNVEFALDEILKKADVSIKMILQGAATNPTTGEEGLMRDDLRTLDLIPITSPYIDAITTNTSTLSVSGTNAIVDWVWIELRDAIDNTSVIASRSALLQRDGDVVDIDGVSSLGFEIPGKPYYVVVNHRNHLGIMSNSAIALSRKTTILDLTNTSTLNFGTDAQKELENGSLALWSGDANGDGQLNYLGAFSDIPAISTYIFNDPNNSVFGGPPTGTFISSGYSNTDINMNGITQYLGASSDVPYISDNIFNNPSNTVFGGPPTGTYIFTQQLPEGSN
ncbi:hypothetical protein [Aurantibacter sp.]|uniref:hypothetical protein n=1 Tax=Aurantibacter sp. TaxID=2807103 RepID=UPI0035C79D5B